MPAILLSGSSLLWDAQECQNALIGSKKINPGGKKQPNKENQPTNQANNQKKYLPQKKNQKKNHQKTE